MSFEFVANYFRLECGNLLMFCDGQWFITNDNVFYLRGQKLSRTEIINILRSLQ